MTPFSTLRLTGLSGLAGLCTLLALPSSAQDRPYLYGGVGVGQSRAELNEGRLTNSLLGPGLRATAISNDKRDTGYKLFGGYQFDRNLAIEAGVFRLGEFGFTTPTAPAGTLGGRIKLQGVNLDLVGTVPITDNLSFLGRVGVNYSKASGHYSGTGAVNLARPDRSERKAGYKAGVGMQYAFSPGFMVRGEAERYRVTNGNGHRGHVDLYSISLVFPFGREAAPAPRAMAAPAPMAAAPMPQAPPPAPMVAAAPPPAAPPMMAPAPLPPPARTRMTFSAESLFGFDQSTLQPEGRDALDSFAKRSEGTRYELVVVEGHTDRLGSTSYNQTLSEQRAETVKAYLVSSGKLDAIKLSTVGKGESEPVTKAEDCKGSRPSAALIACLKPDRRVEVEMNGTR